MKRILFSAAAVILGLSLGLFCGELFFRFNPYFGAIHNFVPLTEKEEGRLAIWNHPHFKGFIRPSDLLGYEHEPNCPPYTNSYGMVGRDHKFNKDPGVFRILLLGDSIAEQGYSAEALEELLNGAVELRQRYRFEVWNAGVGSYDILRYSLFLRNRGLQYKPDMVIVFLFTNDLTPDVNCYYKTKGGFGGYHFPVFYLRKYGIPVNTHLMVHSYLYRFIMLKFDAVLGQESNRSEVDVMYGNGKVFLKEMADFCKQHELDLYIVVFPYLKNLEAFTSYQKQEYSSVLRAVSESGIRYLNLYDFYMSLLSKGESLRLRSDDEMHPSERVHNLIAEKVFSDINRLFLNENNMSFSNKKDYLR